MLAVFTDEMFGVGGKQKTRADKFGTCVREVLWTDSERR